MTRRAQSGRPAAGASSGHRQWPGLRGRAGRAQGQPERLTSFCVTAGPTAASADRGREAAPGWAPRLWAFRWVFPPGQGWGGAGPTFPKLLQRGRGRRALRPPRAYVRQPDGPGVRPDPRPSSAHTPASASHSFIRSLILSLPAALIHAGLPSEHAHWRSLRASRDEMTRRPESLSVGTPEWGDGRQPRVSRVCCRPCAACGVRAAVAQKPFPLETCLVHGELFS